MADDKGTGELPDLGALERDTLDAVEAAGDDASLEEVRVAALGKKT